MTDDPGQLCRAAAGGDEAAARQLVLLHYERVYAWFRRLAGNEAEAADLTQKTFVRVWASLDRFKGQSSFSTWLHGIGRHVYLDWCRRDRLANRAKEPWWQEPAVEGPSPLDTLAERELAEQLYTVVEELDEQTRQTVHLHYYQGLSLAETATVLGVATSTVKYRLRQALQTIRRRLEARNVKPFRSL